MGLDDTIVTAASQWNLDIQRILKNKVITGSPERCEFRFVIQDRKGAHFVIESLLDEDVHHKQRIITALNFLAAQGLETIQSYLPNDNQEYILKHANRFWQLSPFIDGVSPKRPDYVFDKWRGKVLADFLIRLRSKSTGIPGFNASNRFSIKQYIKRLLGQIERYEPALFTKLKPVVAFLEKRFMQAHDTMPAAFCHGDYHMLNVIWSTNGIRAVIDWEFLGFKPEIYDTANMIGCIGVEAPQSLVHECVGDFVFHLKDAGIMSDISWEYLLEFIIALRFAWLSEWLRHNDREMISLETTYMKLLQQHCDDLRGAWGL